MDPAHLSLLLTWLPHQAGPPVLPLDNPALAEEGLQQLAAAWVPAGQSTGLAASPELGRAAAVLLHQMPAAAAVARPVVL